MQRITQLLHGKNPDGFWLKIYSVHRCSRQRHSHAFPRFLRSLSQHPPNIRQTPYFLPNLGRLTRMGICQSPFPNSTWHTRFLTVSMMLDDRRTSCSMGHSPRGTPQFRRTSRNLHLQSVYLRSVPRRCLKEGVVVMLGFRSPADLWLIVFVHLYRWPIPSYCSAIAPSLALTAADRFKLRIPRLEIITDESDRTIQQFNPVCTGRERCCRRSLSRRRFCAAGMRTTRH
jgi:hypothetical protein